MAANTCASKGYACPCSPEYEPSATATPVASSVGGIAELPDAHGDAAATRSGQSAPRTLPIAGFAAGGALLLAGGAWYARRRWPGG
jgi:hypothetical protein